MTKAERMACSECGPIYALRTIAVRGRNYAPGDEVPHPPGLVERGLATTNARWAAKLRESERERRAEKEQARAVTRAAQGEQ